MSLLIISAATLLLLAACTQASTPATGATPYQSPNSSFVNACDPSRSIPPPTPTSSVPPPTSSPTPAYFAEMPPSITIPRQPPPNLPDAATPIANAVVPITVQVPYYYHVPSSHYSGLTVSADGLVLTVLDYTRPIEQIEVTVPGKGGYSATIQRVDPLTGATLLKIDASGLPFVTVTGSTSATYSEPVLVLSRSTDNGELNVSQSFAGFPSTAYAKDALFSLLPLGHASLGYAGNEGSVLLNRNGILLGMKGTSPWHDDVGPLILGGTRGRNRPAVKASYLAAFVQGKIKSNTSAPVFVSSNVEGYWGTYPTVNQPDVLSILGDPVQKTIHSLGSLVRSEDIPSSVKVVYSSRTSGTVLELAYAQPQELRSSDGKLVGLARYIAFLWGRGDGEPDIVLCGAQAGLFGGAFLASDLASLVHAAIAARNSISAASQITQPPLPEENNLDLTYPFKVTIAPDKTTYHVGEAVTFNITIENLSDWSMPFSGLLPVVQVQEETASYVGTPWWRSQAGSESKLFAPHESLHFQVTWQQVDSKGKPISPGKYSVAILLSSARFTIVP